MNRKTFFLISGPGYEAEECRVLSVTTYGLADPLTALKSAYRKTKKRHPDKAEGLEGASVLTMLDSLPGHILYTSGIIDFDLIVSQGELRYIEDGAPLLRPDEVDT